DTGLHTDAVIRAAESACINLRRAGADQVVVSLDETVTVEDVHALLAVFAQAVGKTWDASAQHALPAQHGIPECVQRQSAILTHPVFSRIQSETDMLRYLRGLADKDLALDRTMIPLGSCTMKL